MHKKGSKKFSVEEKSQSEAPVRASANQQNNKALIALADAVSAVVKELQDKHISGNVWAELMHRTLQDIKSMAS